jgi:hypothetical protein
MGQEVIDYFNELAKTAVNRCHDRVADLKFFEAVKSRLAAGENLSSELPQLKNFKSSDAIVVVEKLIKRCYDDMEGFWGIPSSGGIDCKVTYEITDNDIIPRFSASYCIKTDVGAVTFTLNSKGNHVDLDVDIGSVKQVDVDAAIKEVAQRLFFANLQKLS